MQIVTKAHFELLLQGMAEARANADSQVRVKDDVIADLRSQVALLAVERKELLDIILYREKRYQEPSPEQRIAAADPTNDWLTAMQKQVASYSEEETQDGIQS